MPTNEADTIWIPQPAIPTEYTNGTANNIIDPSANNFIDPDGNQIIDTGLVGTLIQPTTWVGSPGN